MPEDLPDDPVLLKQLLEQRINEPASDKGKIFHLEEEVALLRQRPSGRKTERTGDAATPQLPLFDEAESLAEPLDEAGDEEVVAPTRRRGKRKTLPADLPRIEVVHELPEHELTCACGCRKYAISEEVSEQLKIVPMQIPGHQACSQGVRLPRLRISARNDGQARPDDREKHGQSECAGHAADYQIRRWPIASSFRKSARGATVSISRTQRWHAG